MLVVALEGSRFSSQYFIEAICFQSARQTLRTRCRSLIETSPSICGSKLDSLPVGSSKLRKCSGWTVLGSQSPNAGPIHFQARGQLSRLFCSEVQTMPFCARWAARKAIAR